MRIVFTLAPSLVARNITVAGVHDQPHPRKKAIPTAVIRLMLLLSVCASARHPGMLAEGGARKITVFRLPARHSDCTTRRTMKSALVVLALISLAGLAILSPRILTARAASDSGTQPAAVASCVDRYNSLLHHAKSALAAGDRSSTVDLLQRAKSLIPVCPGLQDRQSSAALDSL